MQPISPGRVATLFAAPGSPTRDVMLRALDGGT
jgi:hypothetical protein